MALACAVKPLHVFIIIIINLFGIKPNTNAKAMQALTGITVTCMTEQ